MKNLLLCVALLLTATQASGQIVGPGSVPISAGDGSHDLIAVDLTNPILFGPDMYIVTQFNYQFSLYGGFETRGTITPLLLTFDGGDYTPVAIGAPITFTGPTGFISVPFGGTDTFYIFGFDYVYAGLYWTADAPFEVRMPVGYQGGGNAFVRYQNADPPVVGTPISGGSAGFFDRTYNFSITVVEN